jgi:hypothetical protein
LDRGNIRFTAPRRCAVSPSEEVEAMQMVRTAILATLLTVPALPVAAEGSITLTLNDVSQVRPRNVTVEAVRRGDGEALQVRQTGPYRGFDTDTFAYVPGLDFHDGTIELDVAGSLLPNAPPDARGFIGIAFRVDAEGGSFSCEGIYIRPTNGRAQDQVRRNRSTQYFSYPGYDFDRLRREAPGRYESYVDLVPGEWTRLRIEISGLTARLYVGTAAEPALIVNDLKRGADARGTVGLFVGNGTDGHFRNLTVRPRQS